MEIFAQFESYLFSQGLSKKTGYLYVSSMRRFIKWFEETYGDFNIAAITALDIADYRRYLLGLRKKPATVNHALDVLKSFYSWAYAEKFVSINPAVGIKRIKEQKNGPRWIGKRELGSFVRAVQKHGSLRDQAMVVSLLHTGVRISELLSLRLDNVVIRERSGIFKVYGKGDKYREVPLNCTVRKVLKEYINGISGDWLFSGSGRVGPMTSRSAQWIFKKYKRLSGVDATPHMFRHTFGKMLIDAGESHDKVAALLGHASLNTTARYTIPSANDLERSVEKLSWE